VVFFKSPNDFRGKVQESVYFLRRVACAMDKKPLSTEFQQGSIWAGPAAGAGYQDPRSTIGSGSKTKPWPASGAAFARHGD
jgi:hypothetical protein